MILNRKNQEAQVKECNYLRNKKLKNKRKNNKNKHKGKNKIQVIKLLKKKVIRIIII